MDFPLSSSVILVIAVALWIVWVAPYMLRNGRPQLQPAGELLMNAVDVEKADPQAGNVMKMAAPQETPMTSTQRPESAPGSIDPGDRKPSAPAFRIRYGRLVLAVLGLLSLLTGVVSAALRLFGVGSGWLPAATLLGAVAAVVLLRRLAVRDRRRKVNAAFRSALGAPAGRASEETPAQSDVVREAAVPAKESPLFDAEAGAEKPQAAPTPLTADELRQAALAEAAASGDTSVRRVGDPSSAEGSSWEPVEVPKPTYVEAPKAERPAPEPLDLPEAPKAVGKPSLKQATVRQPEAAAAESKAMGKGQSALSNLDDVLQRRRA
ncbi:hypothetical protein [Arthrobacter sp. C9C5]|uniref:hypothetical protein n=1 Tax=Arthrobacter sp. C9C5 TaxID=2735267 RepID=UPI0032DEB2AF